MIDYPYNAPIILTDAIYTAYGGFTGTSTPNQRSAAYLEAEMQVTEHLNTFLLPTTVTGIYHHDNLNTQILLGYGGQLKSINQVTVYSVESCCECTLTADSGCALIINRDYGIILVRADGSCWYGCSDFPPAPFEVSISFTAGLYSGTSYKPTVLQALTMAAEICLKEVVDKGALEGGAGDPGVQSWNANSYSEQRVRLGNNIFGNSAVANKVKKLLMHIPNKPAGVL
jgi:hypothetical protein